MLNGRWDELEALLVAIPRTVFLEKDRVLHARAALAVHRGDHKEALSVLTSHCFPTYGSLRSMLIQLWWQAKTMEAVEVATTVCSPELGASLRVTEAPNRKANGGVNLTKLETVHLRRKLGCDGDSTSSGPYDDCIRGPPNLGLQYGRL